MTTTAAATLEFDDRGTGLAITLASGDDGNYLSVADLSVLGSELQKAEQTGKQWVLFSQRGRDFCLGRAPGPAGEETRQALIGFVQRLQSLELLTVAAADGGCAGFGVGVFALADISIAAGTAWFQFPEILHGPAPAIVASWLYDRVPYKQGLYWTVTGARFDAEDACRFGLASRVVPAADLAATAKETVRALSELSPAAVHNAKSVARAMSTAPPDLAVRRSMALKWFL
jgi:enoyl-CoA hydratase/carnithine racemase